jgi:uncharacterized protein YdaU (DUF1376 family)
MPRRNLYPMPIEGLIDHPLAMTFPAAAYGMLCRLSDHFWATECRPLPKSQDELRSIARVHKPTWRRWNANILKVFEDIRPELERYYQWRESKASTIRMVGARGRAVREANRRLQALAKNQPAMMAGGVYPKRHQRDPNGRGGGGQWSDEGGSFCD